MEAVKMSLYLKRLENDMIYAIQQFHGYADITELNRNIDVIETLKKLLIEAEKCQTELVIWMDENYAK